MGIRVKKTAYPLRNVPKISTFWREYRVKLQKHGFVKWKTCASGQNFGER